MTTSSEFPAVPKKNMVFYALRPTLSSTETLSVGPLQCDPTLIYKLQELTVPGYRVYRGGTFDLFRVFGFVVVIVFWGLCVVLTLFVFSGRTGNSESSGDRGFPGLW